MLRVLVRSLHCTTRGVCCFADITSLMCRIDPAAAAAASSNLCNHHSHRAVTKWLEEQGLRSHAWRKFDLTPRWKCMSMSRCSGLASLALWRWHSQSYISMTSPSHVCVCVYESNSATRMAVTELHQHNNPLSFFINSSLWPLLASRRQDAHWSKSVTTVLGVCSSLWI